MGLGANKGGYCMAGQPYLCKPPETTRTSLISLAYALTPHSKPLSSTGQARAIPGQGKGKARARQGQGRPGKVQEIPIIIINFIFSR